MLEADKIKKLDVLLDMLGEGKLDTLIDKEEFYRRLQGSPACPGTLELMLDTLDVKVILHENEIYELRSNIQQMEADLRSVIKAVAHLTNAANNYDYDQARYEVRNAAMKYGISV